MDSIKRVRRIRRVKNTGRTTTVQVKRRRNFVLTIRNLSVISLVIVFSSVYTLTASALFGSEDSITNNSVETGILDFSLVQGPWSDDLDGIMPPLDPKTLVTVVNEGTVGFQYTVKAEGLAGRLCEFLDIRGKTDANTGAALNQVFPLTSFEVGPFTYSTSTDQWIFALLLLNPVPDLAYDKECVFNLVFDGWQENLPFGQGFSDTEQIKVAISTAPFSPDNQDGDDNDDGEDTEDGDEHEQQDDDEHENDNPDQENDLPSPPPDLPDQQPDENDGENHEEEHQNDLPEYDQFIDDIVNNDEQEIQEIEEDVVEEPDQEDDLDDVEEHEEDLSQEPEDLTDEVDDEDLHQQFFSDEILTGVEDPEIIETEDTDNDEQEITLELEQQSFDQEEVLDVEQSPESDDSDADTDTDTEKAKLDEPPVIEEALTVDSSS